MVVMQSCLSTSQLFRLWSQDDVTALAQMPPPVEAASAVSTIHRTPETHCAWALKAATGANSLTTDEDDELPPPPTLLPPTFRFFRLDNDSPPPEVALASSSFMPATPLLSPGSRRTRTSQLRGRRALGMRTVRCR